MPVFLLPNSQTKITHNNILYCQFFNLVIFLGKVSYRRGMSHTRCNLCVFFIDIFLKWADTWPRSTRSIIITFYYTYRHVGFTSSVNCLSHRVYQVSGNAKVTHLDISRSVNEDIGRLNITMDHLESRVEIVEGVENSGGDGGQNVFGNWAFVSVYLMKWW